MVKNTVIVPTGAKGGFVVKQPPPEGASRDAVLAEGQACYKLFIGALLSLTDNLVDGAVVPAGAGGPARRRRHLPRRRGRQGDGDLLRPGQLRGARARLLARRRVRLRRLGRLRPQGHGHHRPRRLGVGDPALPRARHRRRRSRTSPSSASATCPATSSATGCCCPSTSGWWPPSTTGTSSSTPRPTRRRPSPSASGCSGCSARRGPTTTARGSAPAAGSGRGRRSRSRSPSRCAPRSAWPTASATLSPVELIRAILLAPVDLLFNGGIGTYVKASTESALDVGDKANDAVRVDGEQLRVRVVGEGGNLGLTQRGRVEYALTGGRVNTDAIDNSAGVDTSDHEVNIKIALNRVVDAGRARRRPAGPRCSARWPTTSPPPSSATTTRRTRRWPSR